MPYAKINDHRIYYETYGKGEPLIMIMGLGADTNWWPDKLIQELAKQYKVIIFDNRGAGKSDPAKAPYTIRDLANDVIKLMQTLSIEKAHILGVSMGGMIAQEIAINYPSKVNKLILVVTSPGGPNSIPPKPEALQQLMMDRSTTPIEEIAEKLIQTLFTKEYIEKHRDEIETFVRKALQNPIDGTQYQLQLNAILQFNTYDKLHNIKSPTLIIAGEKDIIVPPENSKILAEKIPNSKLIILPNAGHGLILEKQEEFLKILLDFLK